MRSAISSALRELRDKWVTVAITIAVAMVGALVFLHFTIPLPWVLGPMATTIALSAMRVNVWIPKWMVLPMYAVLGVLFGTTVSPDIGKEIQGWLPSIAAVMVYVIVTVAMLMTYFRKIAGFDFVTAYFSAAPGGMIPMTALGQSYGGDQRVIALAQSIRLIATVVIVPVSFRLFAGYHPSGAAGTGGTFAALTPGDVAIMIGAAIVGYFVAKRLRVPVPQLLGPMFLLAGLKLSGVPIDGLPGPIAATAQLLIGISIGTTFRGVNMRTVGSVLFHGSIASVMIIILAALVAVAVHPFSGASTPGLILAFAPGGFAELAIVAYTMGIDVTFVVGHQIFRYLIITFGAPVVFSVIHRRNTTQ